MMTSRHDTAHWAGRMEAPLIVLALLVMLAGCGGGSAPGLATGSTSQSSPAWSWGQASITDPTRLVAATDADGNTTQAAPGQVLVTFREDATADQVADLVELAETLGGSVVGEIPGASLLVLQFDADADLAGLQRRLDAAAGVEVACLNEVSEVEDDEAQARARHRAMPTPAPTPFNGSYWMQQIGLQEGWKQLSDTDAWPSVGIVDGGTKSLSSMVSTARLEIVDGVGNPLALWSTTDDHLSRVAALAAADPSTSTWGVAFRSRIFAFDVETPTLPTSSTLENRTVVTYARVVWAVDRALQKGCRVVNLSLGPPITSDSMKEDDYYKGAQRFRRNLVGVVAEAVRKNALICISSGNESMKSDNRLMPGDEPVAGFQSNVLYVASNAAGNPKSAEWAEWPAVVADANEGAVINITAPGDQVSPGPTYAPDSGTSYSSPIVAGAVAGVMQAAPKLSASQVRQVILETASPNVRSTGNLRILDFDAAVRKARATR